MKCGKKDFEVNEEVIFVAIDGSSMRVHIIDLDDKNKKGFIFIPTILFKINEFLPEDVDKKREKERIL